MKRGLLIVISGPSGVGKDTLIRRLLEIDRNLVYSVSGTTRQPRPGEMPDHNYTFLTREKFEALVQQGAFVKHEMDYARKYEHVVMNDDVERAVGEIRQIIEDARRRVT